METTFLDHTDVVDLPQEVPRLSRHPAGGWAAWKSDGKIITLIDSADDKGKHRAFSPFARKAKR